MDIRTIIIDPDKITDRESMGPYMKELFSFSEYFGGGLDALADCLSEVGDETEIVLSEESLFACAESSYAWKTVRVLICAAKSNPNLKVVIRQKLSS